METLNPKKIEKANSIPKDPFCSVCRAKGKLSEAGLCKDCHARAEVIAIQQTKYTKDSLVEMFKAKVREKIYRFEKPIAAGLIDELDEGQGYKRTVSMFTMRTGLASVKLDIDKKRDQLLGAGLSEEDIAKIIKEVEGEEDVKKLEEEVKMGE